MAATDSQGLAQSVGSRAVLRKSGQNTLVQKIQEKWEMAPGARSGIVGDTGVAGGTSIPQWCAGSTCTTDPGREAAGLKSPLERDAL